MKVKRKSCFARCAEQGGKYISVRIVGDSAQGSSFFS
jgi:hypothetical protein